MTAIVIPLRDDPRVPGYRGYGSLPFELDLTCPIPLAPKAVTRVAWPFPLASGHSLSESTSGYFRRRYLETLYLPDILFPLEVWVLDVQRMLGTSANDNAASLHSRDLAASVLSVQQLETRHRKTLPPIVSRLVSTDTTETQSESLSSSSVLTTDELDVLKVAVDLRVNSRSASEGNVPTTKRLSTEFERREALMQVTLLLLLQGAGTPLPAEGETKKRKRSKRNRGDVPAADDPSNALELLMDRIGVWNAVEEMGIGTDEGTSVAGKETGFQAMLKRFWRSVITPNFLTLYPETCASFHLKVFGHPIPSDLVAAPTTLKKPRKPKMTRSRPSSEAVPPVRRNSSSFSQSTQGIPTIRRKSSSFSQPPRAASRAPSETGSRASADDIHGMRRSLSKTSESMPDYRSRSRSIDPPAIPLNDNLEVGKQNRKFGRAPSGADLFKGRQVGFIRRPSGIIGRKDKEPVSQGPVESQSRAGLLGRKLSEGLRGQTESHGVERTEGTLIFATPSKPKLAETLFGPRLSKFVAPTPIQEEPSSGERSMAPSFVAETPVHVRHVDGIITSSHSSFALETPHLSTTRVVDSVTSIRFADMPISQLSAGDDESDGTYHDEEEDEDSGEESDDPLAELMVMTDEELEDADVVRESPI